MSQPPEGARVSYVGQERSGPELGTQGRLLVVTGSAGHVKWDGGRLDGQLTLTALDDLVSITGSAEPIRPVAARDDLEDSLEFGRTAAWSTEDTDVLWDEEGWA